MLGEGALPMRRYISINPVVEFIRKDAEIAIDVDGHSYQVVIARKLSSIESATQVGEQAVDELVKKIDDFIQKELSGFEIAEP